MSKNEPTPANPTELLSPKQLATELQRPLRTLQRWRYERTGPAFIRTGQKIRYRRSDVEAWLEARTVRTGNDAA